MSKISDFIEDIFFTPSVSEAVEEKLLPALKYLEKYWEKYGDYLFAPIASIGAILLASIYFISAEEVRLLFLIMMLPIGGVFGAVILWIIYGFIYVLTFILIYLLVFMTRILFKIVPLATILLIILFITIYLYQTIIRTNTI